MTPELTWADGASCRGRPELFFPAFNERPGRKTERETAAKQVCQRCPVLQPCRAYARDRREVGIWGGETEEERAALRRAERQSGLRVVR